MRAYSTVQQLLVGAGLIQFVYRSHLRLATEATRNRNAFSQFFARVFQTCDIDSLETHKQYFPCNGDDFCYEKTLEKEDLFLSKIFNSGCRSMRSDPCSAG